MIIVMCHTREDGEKWCVEHDVNPKDLKSVVILSTKNYSGVARGRNLTESDKVVWIHGWEQGHFANNAYDALIPAIGIKTDQIFA